MEEFDLFVIGAGSGGVRAARIAGALGARVGIVEMDRLGGTCVNVGCIPKKLLMQAAQFKQEFEDAEGFGWSIGERTHAWDRLIAAKDKLIANLNAGYGRTLENANAELWTGRARLLDAHTVSVDGREARARHILIATGGRPRLATMPGAELAITSDDAFALARLPRRVIVVGGGYIAMEFASIFHGLGAETILVHRSEQVLRGFDADLGPALLSQMGDRGIDLRIPVEVQAIERAGDSLRVSLSNGDAPEVDQVLFCIGRTPMTSDLGLEAAGVELRDDGVVIVDAASRTSVPHIYAVGDITGRVELTPMAIAEGQAVAQSLFGEGPVQADHSNVPSAVFSLPPIAAVGMTEAAAREAGHDVEVFRSTFQPLRHSLCGRQGRTLMKLVVDSSSQLVLGCHMLGPDAPEIIQGMAVALKCGATKAQFDATVGIHPTAAEEFVTMRRQVASPGTSSGT